MCFNSNVRSVQTSFVHTWVWNISCLALSGGALYKLIPNLPDTTLIKAVTRQALLIVHFQCFPLFLRCAFWSVLLIFQYFGMIGINTQVILCAGGKVPQYHIHCVAEKLEKDI